MFKTALLFLHRWLGLISGIIVFIVAITGAIFVFEEELFRLFHPELVYVTPEKQLRDINDLKAAAQNSLGADKPVNVVFIYGEPDRAYCFSVFERNLESTSLWDKDEILYFNHVYVNPYTGAVLGIVDKETEFFYVVRRIHQNLLFRRDIGNMIVGTSTLIFLVILISGLILWWPKRISAWKQRFTIQWKARWRRVNYDLHSVMGFYIFLVAAIIATTGLIWSFEWWENGINSMLGSSKKDLAFLKQRDTVQVASAHGVTLAWQDALHRYEQFNRMTFTFPAKKNSRAGFFVQYDGPSAWTDTDYLSYSGETGELKQALAHDHKPLALKWRNSTYNIHTGKIYGWPTQVLAVFASLVCATLPVTGVVMWFGRRKKNAPVRLKRLPALKRAEPLLRQSVRSGG